jgi:hypothetical protein
MVDLHYVKFQVVTAASIKMTLLVVAPCSLVEVLRPFRGACCLIIRAMMDHGNRPDGGGGKNLLNVGKLLQEYTAQHPRRQLSSSYIFYLYLLL